MSELPRYKFICRIPPRKRRRQQSPSANWLSLPDELLLKIAEGLELQDIYHMMLSCKRWNTVMSDSTIWKCLCVTTYGCQHSICDITWKKHYKKVLKQIRSSQSLVRSDHRNFLCHDHAGYFNPEFYSQLFSKGYCPLKLVIEHGIGRLNYHNFNWNICCEMQSSPVLEDAASIKQKLMQAAQAIKEIRDYQLQLTIHNIDYEIEHTDAVYWCCMKGLSTYVDNLLRLGLSANYVDLFNPKPPQQYSLLDVAHTYKQWDVMRLLWKHGGRFKHYAHLNAIADAMSSFDFKKLYEAEIQQYVQQILCWKQ